MGSRIRIAPSEKVVGSARAHETEFQMQDHAYDELARIFDGKVLLKRYGLDEEDAKFMGEMAAAGVVRRLIFRGTKKHHPSYPGARWGEFSGPAGFHKLFEADFHKGIYYFMPENIEAVLAEIAGHVIVPLQHDDAAWSIPERHLRRSLRKAGLSPEERLLVLERVAPPSSIKRPTATSPS